MNSLVSTVKSGHFEVIGIDRTGVSAGLFEQAGEGRIK